MKLRNIDTNLLVSLHYLLTESSVTGAAKRVGVTQPAMSHALGRLRELFDDPLLVRSGHRMTATPFAERLAAPLAKALHELDALVSQGEEFDPQSTMRTFHIATVDSVVGVMAGYMLKLICAEAPGVNLHFRPLEPERLATQLLEGEIDLALGVFSLQHRGLRCEKLSSDTFLSLVAKDHPLLRGPVTAERFSQFGHIVLGPRGESVLWEGGAPDWARNQRVAVELPCFFAAPLLVRNTTLIVTIPRRMALLMAKNYDLATCELPYPAPERDIFQCWSEKSEEDGGVSWLRNLTKRSLDIYREAEGEM